MLGALAASRLSVDATSSWKRGRASCEFHKATVAVRSTYLLTAFALAKVLLALGHMGHDPRSIATAFRTSRPPDSPRHSVNDRDTFVPFARTGGPCGLFHHLVWPA